jgi:dTDP-4-dehydrorhamnose 3,5-epimerase
VGFKLQVENLPIEGAKLITPKIFQDERGYFYESYQRQKYLQGGIGNIFVQDNQSFSTYGTLRGLHFQNGDFAQAKLVRVTYGKILDVIVDLRKNSSTYKKVVKITLDDKAQQQFFIPRGCAHGFVVLSKEALFQYKCDNLYEPTQESGIIYNDPTLAIDWGIPENDIIISEKDSKLVTFKEWEAHS